MKLLVVAFFAFLVCSGEMSAVSQANVIADVAQSQLEAVPSAELQRANAFKTVETVMSFFAQKIRDGKINTEAMRNSLSFDEAKIAAGLGSFAKRLEGAGFSQLHATTADPAAAAAPAADAAAAAEAAKQEKLDKQIATVSMIFVVAGVLLLVDFLLLQKHFNTLPFKTSLTLSEKTEKFMAGKSGMQLVNFVGLLSAILWFVGFALFVDWIFQLPGPLQLGLVIPAGIKLLASYFFVVQPMTAVLGGDDTGIPFGNFGGILLFHLGNMISAFNMSMHAYDSSHPFAKANFPFWGTMLCLVGTTLLTTANFLVFSKLPPAEMEKKPVAVFQLAGATLLTVGSAMFLIA
eukprot:c45560_g1_i1.p1 GENE.c45560_g1_i1~~c45560_g1_i1.p1  ORF type:complete len:357 (+),score=89.14 c45560_g1_i1:28-1071(+)